MNWQQVQSEQIKKLCHHDWHFADIGACVGEVLGTLESIMSFGYAFEANKSSYDYLIDVYRKSNLVIENLAIANKNGSIEFYNDPSTHDGNLLGHDMSYNNLDAYNVVNCCTLDSYFKDKRIDFIKMDVEGAEWKVFEGAGELLRDRNVLWQV